MSWYLVGVDTEGNLNTLGGVDSKDEVDVLQEQQDDSVWRIMYKIKSRSPRAARIKAAKMEQADRLDMPLDPSVLDDEDEEGSLTDDVSPEFTNPEDDNSDNSEEE